MSRKFDRNKRIERAAMDHIQDPMFATMFFLKTFRPRPVFVPKFVWLGLLRAVLSRPAWKSFTKHD